MPPRDLDTPGHGTRSAASLYATRVDSGDTQPQETVTQTRIGRFVVLRLLGSGAMGVVYSAYDEELDRKVAIKLLRTELRHQRQGAVRMMREAQSLARLSHPNVVQVYEIGESAGRMFIALELVNGRDAREWRSSAPRSWQATLAVYVQAGRGLSAAHQARIVHRDFKPDNVLVAMDGRVCVADFGLASQGDDASVLMTDHDQASESTSSAPDTRLTGAHTIVGTPAYMSPEQHLYQPADARSDQFSFCAALFEALHGTLLFAGRTPEEIRDAVMNRRHSPVPRTDVPPWIREVLMRGMALDPSQRWPDMNALLEALIGRRRRSRLLALAAVSTLAVGAAAAYYIGGRAETAACKGAPDRMATVWSEVRSEALKAALAQTDLPMSQHTALRVTAALDDYSGAWTRAHIDACVAHRRGEQSSRLLDLRMACLQRRLADLDAVVTVLTTADDAMAERAVQTAMALPSLAACDDGEALSARAPVPAELAEQVAQLRAQLSHSAANRAAGRPQVARDLAQEVVDRARILEYGPLLAEALLARSEAEGGLGRAAVARESGNEAYSLALELGHDEVAAQTAVAQIFRTGVELMKVEVADEWARQAHALLGRTDADPELWVNYHRNLGALYRRKDDNVEARRSYEQALAFSEQRPELGGYVRAAILHNIANTYLDDRQFSVAHDYIIRAIDLTVAELGADHPVLVTMKNNLASALEGQGQLAAAEQQFHEALTLCERTRGPDHIKCADPLSNLGPLLCRQGRFVEAMPHMRRALEITTKALGPRHPSVAAALYNLGCALLDQGDFAAARAMFLRSQAINEAALGPTHVSLAYDLTELGRAELELGRPAAALPVLERALTLRQQHAAPVEELANTRFSLARALWPEPAQRPRALELAQQARLGLEGHPRELKLIEEIDAWLAQARAPD